MLNTKTIFALFASAVILVGCTTPDTVTPEQIQIAKLRTELTRTSSDTKSLVNQIEDLSSRCRSLESENASLRNMLSQTQSSLRDVSSKVSETQQGVRELAKTSSRTEDIAALNKAYNQIVAQLKNMNEATLESQRKTDKNLQVIQGDAKTLQGYINENRTKLAQLEARLSEVDSRARQAAQQAAQRQTSSSSGSGSSSSAQQIVRTGKPSSPNISYDSLYEHVVAAGESIWMIARDYGVTITDIYNVNPDLTSTSLRVGQKIRVPKRQE
ncbi:LysM peptidoglycan-binding domain-containing protein [bacterium]|jgi:LysM repeat protein|nr:LysM peptidoglycan-binding domain-containing protein [bacterium]